MFVYTLPFALVDEMGWSTLLATFVLTVGYFGLDAIASEMEVQSTCGRLFFTPLTDSVAH